MIVKYPGFAFIPINKNGSNAMLRALQRAHGLPVMMRRGEAVGLRCPIYAMWREPHDRMASCFRFYKQRGDILLNESFSDFVERWILEPPRFDQHICPQYIFCRGLKRVWLPTHIIRWDWMRAAELMALEAVGIENASPEYRVQWRPDTRKLFDENYELDIAVWQGCDDPLEDRPWRVSEQPLATAAG